MIPSPDRFELFSIFNMLIDNNETTPTPDKIPGPKKSRSPSTSLLLVERENELNALAALIVGAREGKGSIALIHGEAGIGKTSLVNAFLHQSSSDVKSFVGGNDPLTTPRPFGPIFDMVQSFSPSLANLLRTSTPRAQLFDALYSEIKNSIPTPVLIVEDVHWADSATLDFLKYLGRRISSLRCLLVLTYRNDEIGRDHLLSVTLGELPQDRVYRFPLAPLSHSAVAKLASGNVDNIDSLYNLTNGNPFFVSEVLKNSNGCHARLPASITDAVSARVARLPLAERTLVEALSVSPKSVTADFIHQIFGIEAVETAFACLNNGILIEDSSGAFSFRHELTRLAILERTPNDRVRRSHRSFYEAHSLLNDPAAIDLQVYHADGAKMQDEVLRVAPLAAKRAAELGAHGEAFAHLSVALKYIESAAPEVAASIWEHWAGSACVSTSMGNEIIEGRSQAARLWAQVGRPDKAAENLRWQSRLHWYRCEPTLAESVAAEAIDLFEQSNSNQQLALASTLRAQLYMLRLEMKDAISWGENARNLARQCNSAEAEVHAINSIGTAKCFLDIADGIHDLQKSLTLAESTSYGVYAAHDADIARAYLNMADHAAEFRIFDFADTIIPKGLKRCAEIDFVAWVGQLNTRWAKTFFDRGKMTDAEAIAAHVLKNSALTPQMELAPKLLLARISSRRDEARAEVALRHCLKLGEQAQDPGYVISCHLALIEHSWMNDNRDAAKRHLLALREIDKSKFHIWNEADRLRWEQSVNGSANIQPTSLPKGFKAQLEGDTLRAVDILIANQLPFDAAIALLHHAEKAPAKFLPLAEGILTEIESKAAINKCYRLASKFNVTNAMRPKKRGPYNISKCHPLNLTKREIEILGFIVEGATNKEISQKVHRSPRTIDQHVSSILKKLNVSNRVEAILRVKDEPWIL